MTILLLSRQNCGEIMIQNLCSKQEKLLQPQEEDIKRFSKGEQTSIFFWRYFPLTMRKLENVRITFSSCSPYLTASSLATDNNKWLQLTYQALIIVCRLSLIKTYILAFHILRKFHDSAPLSSFFWCLKDLKS